MLLLGPDEEVSGLTREHDRIVRRVNPLFTEIRCSFAQPLPRVVQIFRKAGRESLFCGGPAVVLLGRLDALVAVVTFSAHGIIVLDDAVLLQYPQLFVPQS
jgi:hypothetical protein